MLTLRKEHLGQWLAVLVEADVDGEAIYSRPHMVKTKVSEVDEEFVFEERQRLHCADRLDGSRFVHDLGAPTRPHWYTDHLYQYDSFRFRLCSYNILADLYLKSSLKKDPQDELFFPYCPREYQMPEYRYPILMRELSGLLRLPNTSALVTERIIQATTPT